MAVCYDKLFHLMIDKKISNVQLKDMAGVSANIITRLKRDEYISTESIEKMSIIIGFMFQKPGSYQGTRFLLTTMIFRVIHPLEILL